MSLLNYWMFDKVCYYLNMIYLLSFQQKEPTRILIYIWVSKIQQSIEWGGVGMLLLKRLMKNI